MQTSLLFLFIVVSIETASGSEPQKCVSAEDICHQLNDVNRRINSLFVTYQSDVETDNGGDNMVKGGYLRRTVAVLRPGYFLHWNAHGSVSLSWENDPFQQQLFVNLTKWHNVNPINNSFSAGELRPDEPLPGSAPNEFYFSVTGLWPMDRPAPRFNGEPYLIPDIVASGLYTAVRPEREWVHDRLCHVLERPTRDYLWVDSARPGTLVAREVFSEDGVRLQRFELHGHTEVCPGVWLPKYIRNQQFSRDAKLNETRPRLDAKFTVLEMSANAVDVQLFNWTPQAGSLQLRPGEAPTQVIPGGAEHLHKVSEWIAATSRVREQRKESSLSTVYLIASVLGFLSAVLYEAKKRIVSRIR